jgi:phosphatidylethanolamine-binding protein (PEBP) family uncharacterized protein
MSTHRTRSFAPWLASALALLAHCGGAQPTAPNADAGSGQRGGAAGANGGRTGSAAGGAGAGSALTAGHAGAPGAGVAGSSGAGAGLGGIGGLSGDLGANALTLTSTAAPTNGVFLDASTCAGADTSPDLDWAPGLARAQSYAIVLTDTTTGAAQWVVWDIPATVTSLPAALPASALLATPAGAKQVSTSGNGYVGPCPNGQERFYEFTIFALPVTTLPNVTTQSSPSAVATAINLTPPIALAFFGASSSATAIP